MLAQIASQARILLAPLDLRVAFLVPAPDYPEAWDWAFDVEAGALRRARARGRAACRGPSRATSAASTSSCRWSPGAITSVTPSGWRCSTGSSGSGCRSSIPSPLLRWNSDKAYLAELGRQGRRRPSRRWPSTALDEAALAERARRVRLHRAGDQAAGLGLRRRHLPAAARATRCPSRSRGWRMLVQPWLASIARRRRIFADAVRRRASAMPSSSVPKSRRLPRPAAPWRDRASRARRRPASMELAEAALAAAPAPSRPMPASTWSRRRRRAADHRAGADRAGAVARACAGRRRIFAEAVLAAAALKL